MDKNFIMSLNSSENIILLPNLTKLKDIIISNSVSNKNIV